MIMTDTPRAYTSDELRETFLHEVRTIVKIWADPKIERDLKGRCSGVAFSILALLDGCSVDIPSIDLVFQPHEDDKEYYTAQGSNWIEPGTVVTDLHDNFY